MQFIKIKSITRNEQPEPVYDIQVKKNHNFFANDMLVHNCVIFQEQIMELCHVVAGFPKEDCDKVRRTIMKRSASKADAMKAEAESLKQQFVDGSVANGVDRDVADELYENILYFSGYGFNKSCTYRTPVYTYTKGGHNQVLKAIEDVQPGEYVRSRDEVTGEEIFVEVIDNHDHGVIPVYEFELEDGSKVECTMDHKFRTTDGRMCPMWQILEEELSIVADAGPADNR